MKELAASTTAVGRDHIMKAKNFMEEKGATVLYGDTDSVFVTIPNKDNKKGKAAIKDAISNGQTLSSEFNKLLKFPHNLEYEKCFWPFVIFSKKRYCANKYEFDDTKFKQNSMGIVLKRRDQAVGLMKEVYGGAIDIILNEQNIAKAFDYIKRVIKSVFFRNIPCLHHTYAT